MKVQKVVCGVFWVLGLWMFPLAGEEVASEPYRDRLIFEIPLIVGKGRVLTPVQKERFEELVQQYQAGQGRAGWGNVALLEGFVRRNVGHPFNDIVLYEAAQIGKEFGYFEKRGVLLEEAWRTTLSRDRENVADRQTSDTILKEYFDFLGRLGRKEALRALLDQVESWDLSGAAHEARFQGKVNLWFLDNRAEQNVFCGFGAVNAISKRRSEGAIFPDVHSEEEKQVFIRDGLSLYELKAHCEEGGLEYQMVKRLSGSGIPVPSVIHFRFQHYAALTESLGKYGVRLEDEHLKFNGPVLPEILNEQASGYFLVPRGVALPDGFTVVAEAEAKQVFGRHCVHGRDDEGVNPRTGEDEDEDPTLDADQDKKGCFGNNPMADYTFSLLHAGLVIADTPISYRPPVGPGVSFRIEYIQQAAAIDDSQLEGNFGPRWTHRYASYLKVGYGSPSFQVRYVDSKGAYFTYRYDLKSQSYDSRYGNLPRLRWIAQKDGGPGYELQFSNGAKQRFFQSNGTFGQQPTRYYLSEVVDPQGNALHLLYDRERRLVGIRDVLGQLTRISYEALPGESGIGSGKKIRKIVDPFGREATFQYDPEGRLVGIRDPIGIESKFEYEGGFVKRLKTPYGATHFAWGDLPGLNSVPGRFIEATDPLGNKERVEANDMSNFPSGGEDPHPAPKTVDVAGTSVSFLPKNAFLFYRNTFYWDKKMWKEGAGDFSKARVYNWLALNGSVITGTLASTKNPLEGRVWYNYPGQTDESMPGSHLKPSKIVRAVESGADGSIRWTMWQRKYENPYGKLTEEVDPEGRRVRYRYAEDGIDLLAVEAWVEGGWKSILTFTGYEKHRPLGILFASGMKRTLKYNARGQLVESIDVKAGQTKRTFFVYNTSGYLTCIQKSVPGGEMRVVALFKYDEAGRVGNIYRWDGELRKFQYDALDRVTRVDFSDGTWEVVTYKDLDISAVQNRAGLRRLFYYNPLRQLIASVDPMGRMTRYAWCKCGALRVLTDANGNRTQWVRDAQGRVVRKGYADGSAEVYRYQPFSGRLDQVWLPKAVNGEEVDSQATVRFAYSLSGRVVLEDYAKMADVQYVYEKDLGRLAERLDGQGTTRYSYWPLDGVTNGAGQLSKVDGPLDADTMRVSYDWQGEIAMRGLGEGIREEDWKESVERDVLGRVQRVKNGVGEFVYRYDPYYITRVDEIDSPNGLVTKIDYYEEGSGRLKANQIKSIRHEVGGEIVSFFGYDYNGLGLIETWEQNQLSRLLWEIHYNDLGEVEVGYNKEQNGERYSWSYDAVGNWLSSQEGSMVKTRENNVLNQVIEEGGGGSMMVIGVTDEPAEVKINGEEVSTRKQSGREGNLFRKEIEVKSGKNVVEIEVKDGSGNADKQKWEFEAEGEERRFTYDRNGNMTSDGKREYEWDEKNRLIGVKDGERSYAWEYDGSNRRILEREDGKITKRWVWSGMEVVQERNGKGEVKWNGYGNGYERGGNGYAYTQDQLGSIRELIGEGGKIGARYGYGLWGKRKKLSGEEETAKGFTGHYQHEGTGLVFAPYRVYSPELGRWLSRDPMGESGGVNLYGYVLNDPVNAYDPDGLDVVFLYDAQAAGIRDYFPQGHSAAFIGNDEAGWHYFSKDGKEGKQSINTHRQYGSLKDFIRDGMSERYDNAYRQKTSTEQDQKMIVAGEKYFNSEYNLINNNCGDLVISIMNAGGILGDRGKVIITFPWMQFNAISEDTRWIPIPLN